jgi:Domain of unknown function (DUF4349)
MSQRDVLAELQAARLTAPAELRERIRLVAATADPTPPRRFTWRRALVVAVPVAAAIAATVVVTRPTHHRAAGEAQTTPLATYKAADAGVAHGGAVRGAPSFAPAPTRGRVQTIRTTLSLRIPTAVGVSDAVKRALAITGSLGGYPAAVHAQSHGASAHASLTLKIPRAHVQEAMKRLGALGTITAEQLAVADKQASLNATDRTIARLQKELAALPPGSKRAAALTQQIQGLQRAEAAARRAAHYATVYLALSTPPAAVAQGHGPLHGIGVALRWLGIGALYALAIGLPIVLVAALAWLAVRFVRRRREDALLNDL